MANGSVASTLYSLMSGQGATALALKKEFHRQRESAERQVLANPKLWTPASCPACRGSATASRRLTTPLGAAFSVCSADGTVFENPLPTEDALDWLQTHASQAYPYLRGSRLEPQPLLPDFRELGAFERLLPGRRGQRLLDAGCGDGAFLLAARGRYAVSGVDPHPRAAALARNRGLDVAIGRLESMHGDGAYDLITLICVVEHAARPEGLLAAARRLLVEGGALYVVTPNIGSSSFAYLGEKHSHLSSISNVALYNFNSLCVLARRCGFDMVSHEFTGGRDLTLSDLITHRLSPTHFRHRMTSYRPVLHQALATLENMLPPSVEQRLFPSGEATFQRAVLVPR